jgi:hypothetical protein
MIMDRIPVQRPAGRPYINRKRRTLLVQNSYAYLPAPSRTRRKQKARKPRPSNVPTALRTQAAALRLAKTSLERSYNQEQNFNNLSGGCTGLTLDFQQITAAIARAERRYVNCLIRYLRDANQMTSVEATEMQRSFTRQKMEKAGTNNRVYLLGRYPHELT